MMVDKKRKVPNLRFKGFTNDWVQRNLASLGKVFTGNTPKTSENENWTSDGTGHVWITPTDIQQLHTSNSDRHLSDIGWEKARVVPEKSVLITSIASIGKNTINTVPAAFNQQINAIVPEGADAEFILAVMEKESARFASLAGQTATAIINKTEFEKFKINAPSFDEQIRIGELFSKVDMLIAANQRKLDLLKEQKKGYLQKMFPKNGAKVPELRFAGFADAWEQRKLGEVAEKVYSGLSGKTKSDFGHGEAAYVTYINVHDNVIAKAKEIEKVEVDLKQDQVQKGDIFFTISSEVPEEVALNSVWPYETNTRLYLNSFCFGYRSNFKLVNPFFLSYYLRSPHLRQIIFPLAQGISRFNISKKSILQLPIKLPKLQEQKDIYRILQDLENLLSLQQQKLAKYQSVKKSLLQQMFI